MMNNNSKYCVALSQKKTKIRVGKCQKVIVKTKRFELSLSSVEYSTILKLPVTTIETIVSHKLGAFILRHITFNVRKDAIFNISRACDKEINLSPRRESNPWPSVQRKVNTE